MARGFAIIQKYVNSHLNLPKRATKHAAGYDFEAAEDFLLPSIWKLNFIKILWALQQQKKVSESELDAAQKVLKPYLVPTGIKAFMNHDEYLMLANRSSGPLKRGLVMPNGVGIIDADYYDNPKNEGAIFFQLVNYGIRDTQIKKGDRIGQGIFMPYLTADAEEAVQATRTGGFGSSGK